MRFERNRLSPNAKRGRKTIRRGLLRLRFAKLPSVGLPSLPLGAFRHGYVSPSSCTFLSLCDRDALPFNRPIRNFKRNSACYEQQRRNFDRIELNSRSAKRGDSRRPRRSRRKDENSKRDRRSRADSVETLRMRSICVLNRLFDPHLCPKPLI